MTTKEFGQRLLSLRDRIEANFLVGDWEEIGLLTGHSDIIRGHDRLIRSLSFGDKDYSGNILQVLRQIANNDVTALDQFDDLLERKYPEDSNYVSAKPSIKKITFAPHVFELTDVSVESDLVAVMMPFSAEFAPVHDAIKQACAANNLRCLRADDIWLSSTIIQDIFTLLLKARVVIVDFTGRNSNVMYETGIAHTLGKLVIPITQSLKDVPFDVAHHRALVYLSNNEGRAALSTALRQKLSQI